MLTGSMSGEIVPTTYPVFYKPCKIESLVTVLELRPMVSLEDPAE